MRTNHAPRSTDHPASPRILFANAHITGCGILPINLNAASLLCISARISTAVKYRRITGGILLNCICFFLLALLTGVIQNEALGENKLSDNLTIREIQEKNYSLHFDKERLQLQVKGTLEIGILSAFEKMLSKHPESTEVAFNSNGGNIYQARGLAKVIMSNALDTFVLEDCYSACTIAYVAGKTRYMSPGGRLGFHQYSMKYRLINQRLDIDKEQAKDLSFFKSRIQDDNFIEKIFSSKDSELWIPEPKDLLKTGVVHEIVPDSDR